MKAKLWLLLVSISLFIVGLSQAIGETINQNSYCRVNLPQSNITGTPQANICIFLAVISPIIILICGGIFLSLFLTYKSGKVVK